MDKNVPTILKSLLQTSSLLKQPYVQLPYTTLNQKLNVQSAAVLAPDEIPSMQYVVIGNGGLQIATGADGVVFTESIGHKPSDTGLFNEIPFIVRPVNSDIGGQQRAKYRLRTNVTVGGNNYIAYYGKVLDLTNIQTSLQTRSVAPDGSVNVANFTHGASNLTPIPTGLAPDTSISTADQYISTSTIIDFILGPQDVVEILNSASVLYGNSNRAIISELALCSGVDRIVPVDPQVPNVTYTEAIAVQVMNFLATNFPTTSFSSGATFRFDIGNSESLLVVNAQ